MSFKILKKALVRAQRQGPWKAEAGGLPCVYGQPAIIVSSRPAE